MPAPVWTVNTSTPVLFCWEGSESANRAVRINSLWQGGHYYVTTAAGTNVDWTKQTVRLGLGCAIGEILVWNSTLTYEQRAELSAYLGVRWGLNLTMTGGVAHQMPEALLDDVFDTTNLGSDMRIANGTPDTTVGSIVKTWFSRKGNRSLVAASTTSISPRLGQDADGFFTELHVRCT